MSSGRRRFAWEKRGTCPADGHDTLHAWRVYGCRCPAASADRDRSRARLRRRHYDRVLAPVTSLDWVDIQNGHKTLHDFNIRQRHQIINALLDRGWSALRVAEFVGVCYRTALRYQRVRRMREAGTYPDGDGNSHAQRSV